MVTYSFPLMQYVEGVSCWTGWVWINVYWLEKPPPPISDWLSNVLPEWVWGFFYFLWTRVVETIAAAVDSIWDVGGQKKKLWAQAMLLLSTALFLQFWRSSGEKTPLWQIRRIRMPSQTPIRTRKRAFRPTQKIKRGGGVPPAHSQFCLLTPFLISQTTKEVWYQEFWACRRSTTVDCVKYIVNMKYAISNMQRECPAGWAGFESMFIDWKNPLP